MHAALASRTHGACSRRCIRCPRLSHPCPAYREAADSTASSCALLAGHSISDLSDLIMVERQLPVLELRVLRAGGAGGPAPSPSSSSSSSSSRCRRRSHSRRDGRRGQCCGRRSRCRCRRVGGGRLTGLHRTREAACLPGRLGRRSRGPSIGGALGAHLAPGEARWHRPRQDRAHLWRLCLRVLLPSQIVIWDLSLQRMLCIMVDLAASPIMMLNVHTACYRFFAV